MKKHNSRMDSQNTPQSFHVAQVVFSLTWGGAETVVQHLQLQLHSMGWRTTIICNTELVAHFASMPRTEVVDVGPLAAQGFFKHAAATIQIRKKLLQSIQRINPDVIHAHLERSLIALTLPRITTRIPIVYTLHGAESIHYKSPHSLEQRAIKRGLRILLKSPNVQVVSCAHQLLPYYEEAIHAKITVIPNGIDVKEFTPKVAKRNDLVFFVGRLTTQKGIATLVAAADLLPKTTFWVVGSGPLETLLHRPNIVTFGFRKGKQLQKLWEQATVCAFPSIFEAFPIVGLEAMALGKPVIATAPGFTEYLKHDKNGIVIPIGDSKALAQAIERVLAEKALRTRLSKEARKTAEQFSWSKSALAYEQTYMRLIEESQ